jgi:hypothetical protein
VLAFVKLKAKLELLSEQEALKPAEGRDGYRLQKDLAPFLCTCCKSMLSVPALILRSFLLVGACQKW